MNLLNSKGRKDFDNFFKKEYNSLVESARFSTDDAHDLVHHVYLRIITQDIDLTKVLENPKAYFKKAMDTEATRGQFKKIFKISDRESTQNLKSESTLERAINKEQLWLAIQRLHWFDRQVLTLHLEGHNLAVLSKETGISESVLYTSVHRSKKKLRNYFGVP